MLHGAMALLWETLLSVITGHSHNHLPFLHVHQPRLFTTMNLVDPLILVRREPMMVLLPLLVLLRVELVDTCRTTSRKFSRSSCSEGGQFLSTVALPPWRDVQLLIDGSFQGDDPIVIPTMRLRRASLTPRTRSNLPAEPVQARSSPGRHPQHRWTRAGPQRKCSCVVDQRHPLS